jgi:hypothetical protein
MEKNEVITAWFVRVFGIAFGCTVASDTPVGYQGFSAGRHVDLLARLLEKLGGTLTDPSSGKSAERRAIALEPVKAAPDGNTLKSPDASLVLRP